MTQPTEPLPPWRERLESVAELCASGTWTLETARREVYGTGGHSNSLPRDLRAALAQLDAARDELEHIHRVAEGYEKDIDTLTAQLDAATERARVAEGQVASLTERAPEGAGYEPNSVILLEVLDWAWKAADDNEDRAWVARAAPALRKMEGELDTLRATLTQATPLLVAAAAYREAWVATPGNWSCDGTPAPWDAEETALLQEARR